MDIGNEIQRYLELLVDWHKYGASSGYSECFDFVEMRKGIDIFKFWRDPMNRERFPTIFLTACVYLAIPVTNCYQERVFSVCSMVDSDLRQNLKSEKFEKLCLLKWNRKYIDDIFGGMKFKFDQHFSAYLKNGTKSNTSTTTTSRK
jgi:hypothetical protein